MDKSSPPNTQITDNTLIFIFIYVNPHRALDSDDIMMARSEIKRVALDVEVELFNYYSSASNAYRNKYRTILHYIKDPKNIGFFRRVLGRRPNPYKLVRLSDEEIGSPGLSRYEEHRVSI